MDFHGDVFLFPDVKRLQKGGNEATESKVIFIKM